MIERDEQSGTEAALVVVVAGRDEVPPVGCVVAAVVVVVDSVVEVERRVVVVEVFEPSPEHAVSANAKASARVPAEPTILGHVKRMKAR